MGHKVGVTGFLGFSGASQWATVRLIPTTSLVPETDPEVLPHLVPAVGMTSNPHKLHNKLI